MRVFRNASRAVPVIALLLPALASAHEVYVLTPQETATGVQTPAFNMLQTALDNMHSFLFWGFITFIVITTVFCISIFRRVEVWLAPFFDKLKRYAPAICRITVGLGLLAGAYYGATYGPELPLAPAFGAFTPLIQLVMALCGLLMLVGVWVRLAALAALILFCNALLHHGVYMLTYANYLGEFIVLLFMGTHGKGATTPFIRKLERRFAPYSFSVLRVFFGISLLYASFYAKILHNDLALQVASLPLAGHAHPLAYYFGFEPHFLVLGAAIIELVIGAFFVFGVEIRWTSLFMLFWLSLSLWYFGESVWPHIILIGIPIAFFFHGYDRYSLEGRFFKKHRLEPVL